MKTKDICLTLLCLILPCSVAAAEPQFANFSEEIISQLTEENDFGPSRSFTVNKSPSRSIIIRMNKKGKELEKTILVKDGHKIGVVRLKVEFDAASARLRPSSYDVLRQLGIALADSRLAGQQVCIKGHTDSDGDDAYNRRLSYQRAESVRQYVAKQHNLGSADLFIIGYGEQMPLTDNNTPAKKQMNRRVEITLGCSEAQ